ncbi:glutamine amidotransferase-like class 1 domain-containing protein 1 [Sycon ciliatum]|uniref:glutamine amidotransferase-like class 1 domain-containing protein 1 n=1 Tax=Sycon ciliatum TaxID=27933 RepID=UPI0020A8EB91|eukprot:scpid92368/ scgid26427/ Parkinson disease 7 domain-containing protein 1
MATKPNCLIVASASAEGVSARSFVNSFTLTTSAFNVQLATPSGQAVEYINVDESSKRWLTDFASKPYSTPAKLENCDPSRYSVLLIPSGPGAVFDLATDQSLAHIITQFVAEQKPICAVGMGVCALCCAMDPESRWRLKGYSLTAPPTMELAKQVLFPKLPLLPEDFIREQGGSFSSNFTDGNHVVIDRHVITGQNDLSTLTAVQNLILLGNARQAKK